MKTIKENFGYIEGKNSEEMHFSSLNWLSEMIFFADEQQFFKDALTNYTSAVLETRKLEEVRQLVIRISASEKEQTVLLRRIKKHKKELEMLVSHSDMEVEDSCRKEHLALLLDIHKFKKDFRKLKKDVFQILTLVLKAQKQKRLIAAK